MGNSGIKQHYETASKTGVLQLSNHKLKEIPEKVISLKGVVRNLDLSSNKLDTFPDNLSEFKLLKQLKLNDNQLKTIPESIGSLVKLEVINFSDNQLRILPRSLNNLCNLKQVDLSNNKLVEFPLQFCGLKHLDSLNLSCNKITCIPPGVSELYIAELVMNQNQVSSIADELADCPKLRVLRLEENCLSIEMIPIRLLRDSKIHTLSFEGNLFEQKQLTALEGYNEYMERFTAVKKKMF